MDSVDLLAREEEFKKLNKQLEKKTVSLMKEIEDVMHKQDIFSEFTTKLYFNDNAKEKKHCCSTPSPKSCEDSPVKVKHKVVRNETKRPQMKPKDSSQESSPMTNEEDLPPPDLKNHSIIKCNCCSPRNRLDLDMEFFYAFLSVGVQEKVLPASFLRDKASVESVCKFLSSKVKLLQEQIDKVQCSLDRKVQQCECHLTQIAEFEGERLKLLNNANNMKSQCADIKAKLLASQNRLNEKERLHKEERSSNDKLSSEVKRLRAKNANVEAKCVSQEQEIDRLKQLIDTLKMSEKEFKSSSRNLSASHTNAISRLEGKIKTLTHTIDKQRHLVDNLRQQNAVLTSEICLKGLEKEFCEFLNQD